MLISFYPTSLCSRTLGSLNFLIQIEYCIKAGAAWFKFILIPLSTECLLVVVFCWIYFVEETTVICIVVQIMLERLAKDNILQNVLAFE